VRLRTKQLTAAMPCNISMQGPGIPLELFLSARHLRRMDMMSESDALCRIYFKDSFQPNWSEIGVTEVMKNQAHPNWARTFPLMYLFEVEQFLMFEVVDDDGRSGELIGKATTSVGAIMGNKGTLILDLKRDGNAQVRGKLIVRGEQVHASRESATLEIHGQGLDDKDFWSKSDPFFAINRLREDGQMLPVYRSEVIDNNLNPMWRSFVVKVQTLCNSDPHMPLIVECWDNESSGSHQFIGKAETNLEKLRNKETMQLLNPQKRKNDGRAGSLLVRMCNICTEYEFTDYLRGGTQLSLMVAIDFTGSNGAPSQSSSLHYLRGGAMNSYERAIWSVGSILEPYDSTKTFPVWGFGGRPSTGQAVSHCFSLTNGEVVGVQGILGAYRSCLEAVELSGPTLFEHIIRTASDVARRSPPGDNYTVLLILTDGAIHDMPMTKSLIVDASVLPMSIIIVGIGNADFENMVELDCDSGMLADERGRKAARDIVQFVPFRKFEGDGPRLAREVLAEVPKQLVQFMKHHGVVPRMQEAVAMANIDAGPAPSAPPS